MRPGLRDELITEAVRDALGRLGEDRAVTETIDAAEAPYRLARFAAAALEQALELSSDGETITQSELTNRVLELVASGERIAEPPQLLTGIRPPADGTLGTPTLPPRPEIPLSASDLLVNGVGQPTIGRELERELRSAESVDLICAFVIWSGVRLLREPLAELVERGGRFRLITTTYMAATEPRALIALHELGAEIRLAYDAQTTKLHAKSWILERPGGLSTAFVGSSNLSRTALHDGLEWNVRLAEADSPRLLERIRATFDAHWESGHFERFDADSELDRKRLRTGLGRDQERRSGRTSTFASLDVHPYSHQQRMLERLEVERRRHDRHRNLLVAATGTGKTVVAALDYRALCAASGRDLSLLFVAHRERILEQSRAMFAQVLRRQDFGEVLSGGRTPIEGRQVFAMIQSLDEERISQLASDAYDVVIVDEFHHAAAPSYRRLLAHLDPVELLGLTATPERMDGHDITDWFGGRIAVELRLWEAIDQGFLAPFQYFGVADGTDLSKLEWRAGGYVDRQLSDLLTGDDVRVRRLLAAIRDIVDNPSRMRALGFCVSVAHAEFMAQRFNDNGLPAVAISGNTPIAERDAALARLSRGELTVIFSVDVLGEGVDVPDVDTLLLLRPTQSPTVFSQQLGRGLRRSEGKRCLTVLDLIGQQHRSYRFDRRLAALVDRRNGPVRNQIEAGFPLLPAGCDVRLDRESEAIVLTNLKDAARLGRWPMLVEDLEALGDVGMAEFLEESSRELVDLYRGPDHSWTRLRRDTGLRTPEGDANEAGLLRALGRMLHIDDGERVGFYRELLGGDRPPREGELSQRRRRLALMLHFDLWGVSQRRESLEASMAELWHERAVRAELGELLGLLDASSEVITHPLGLEPEIPLLTHGRYSRDEALAAVGVGTVERPPQLREGVRWVEEAQVDLLFVTLRKSESHYSPTTMYRDYAISPELFHWESQSTLSERAPTAQRYINHAQRGSHVLILVRDRPRTATGTTAPYTCLGPATYESHRGERPLAITWRLRTPMPEELFESARAVAA